jgi:hypothetical protein
MAASLEGDMGDHHKVEDTEVEGMAHHHHQAVGMEGAAMAHQVAPVDMHLPEVRHSMDLCE